jgi:hypothetical protein
MTRRWFTVTLVVAAAFLFMIGPWGDVSSQAVQQVIVTNFPNLQYVDGEVEVRGPVRQSKLVALREITVPPVALSDNTRWIDGGVVTTDGFPRVVLSLHGVVKGMVQRSGSVGAILVPDEQSVQEAFEEQGLIHFPLNVVADGVSAKTPYFASAQPLHTIAFRDYKVWLYNSTDKTVTVNLFAYLTD